MSSTRTTVAVRSVFALYVLIELFSIGLTIHLLISHPGVPIYDYYLEGAIGGLFLAALTLLMVIRRPLHPVTWALLAASITGAIQGVLGSYAVEALVAAPGVLPLGELALGLSAIAQTWFVLSFILVINLFPTGRTLEGAWRIIPILIALVAIVSSVPTLTGPMELGADMLPPLLDGDIPWIIGALNAVLTGGVLLASVGHLVVRYRRSAGIERQQLKWFVFSFIAGLVVLFLPWTENDTVGAILWTLVPVGVMATMVLAILRYGLYEIDRIISRTVTYALVVGLLALAVAGVAALIGSRFQEPVVVAATTLGVAALFNPLRRRVQAAVDRRFNRSLFDAGRVMDEFASSLRDRVDAEGVVDGWQQVVTDTMQPATIGVWVRNDRQLPTG